MSLYRLSSESELNSLTGRRQVLDKLPRGAARNQSKQHTELVKSCLEWLRLNGVFCWKNHAGAMKVGNRFITFGMNGLGDILGAMPGTGVLFTLEVKTGDGVQRKNQRDMQRRFEETGAVYFVVRSVAELEEWFR